MTGALVVNEIFLSLQGESTFAGLPCVFIRLTGCNLRCAWCDTAYAFSEGARLDLDEVLQRVETLAQPFAAGGASPALPLVELTGGEPLLQPASLVLLERLAARGRTVLLETSGAIDIGPVDPRVRRIMDLKCPSSGESARIRWENLERLRPSDELKFVIASVEDYRWARRTVAERRLASLCPVLFSWAEPLTPAMRDASLKPFPADHTPLSRRELAERIVADALPVRLQTQLHKLLWPPETRGV